MALILQIYSVFFYLSNFFLSFFRIKINYPLFLPSEKALPTATCDFFDISLRGYKFLSNKTLSILRSNLWPWKSS